MINIQINAISNYYYINNGPRIGILPSIIPNKPFVSCSLINLDFLLQQTT